MFSPMIGKTYDFYYTRRDGKVIKRMVRVMERGNGYFRGFCFLRWKPRTFDCTRVVSAIEPPLSVSAMRWDWAQKYNIVPAAWKGK